MTPMIDVLLVLIIIFMVIMPSVPTGLKTSLPQSPDADAPQAVTPRDVVITVVGDGTVRLNDEPLDLSLLHEHLLRILGTRSISVVFIRGEKDLDFGQVAEVIDITKGSDVGRVGLMTR